MDSRQPGHAWSQLEAASFHSSNVFVPPVRGFDHTPRVVLLQAGFTGPKIFLMSSQKVASPHLGVSVLEYF